jgi:hypothetical protein
LSHSANFFSGENDDSLSSSWDRFIHKRNKVQERYERVAVHDKVCGEWEKSIIIMRESCLRAFIHLRRHKREMSTLFGSHASSKI